MCRRLGSERRGGVIVRRGDALLLTVATCSTRPKHPVLSTTLCFGILVPGISFCSRSTAVYLREGGRLLACQPTILQQEVALRASMPDVCRPATPHRRFNIGCSEATTSLETWQLCTPPAPCDRHLVSGREKRRSRISHAQRQTKIEQ